VKPLASLERAEAKGLVGILFDLDDTFLDEGALTEGPMRRSFAFHGRDFASLPSPDGPLDTAR